MNAQYVEFARRARRAVAPAILLLFVPVAGQAADVPAPDQQEIMIKSSLLTFNDANLTGNYDVLQASMAKPFRDQYSADKLKEIFKQFADQKVSIRPVVIGKPVMTDEVKVDDRGALLLHGYFDVAQNYRVTFSLDYAMSEGEWKPITIIVKVGEPGAQ